MDRLLLDANALILEIGILAIVSSRVFELSWTNTAVSLLGTDALRGKPVHSISS